jgi:hypothetical protein
VASTSFLISIARREQVAIIRGKPVYTISEVALIPLSSQQDAEQAIVRARDSQQRHSQTKDDFLSDSSDDEDITLPDDTSVADPEEVTPLTTNKIEDTRDKVTTVAEDVFAKKGLYGRFTDSWFSKKGWTADQRRKQGLSSQDDLQRVKKAPKDPAPAPNTETDSAKEKTPAGDLESAGSVTGAKEDQLAPAEVAHVVNSDTEPQIPLLPKVLTTTKIFFGSKNFFFSYDYDLSRSTANQPAPSGSLNLYRTFDPLVSVPCYMWLQVILILTKRSSSGIDIFFNHSWMLDKRTSLSPSCKGS